MKENLNDLRAFVTVARERSFTRAAAHLGLSRSALSHAMLALEERLGVRLLTRTTRSVSTTEAGARLLNTVASRIDEIEQELSALRSLQHAPAGNIRITAHDHAVSTVLWPRLMPLLRQHPDISVELNVDYGFTDIADQRFDLGIRLGDEVNKDMIAVRVAPDMQMVVVGSPDYFSGRTLPARPDDLIHHSCINLRLPTHGGLYAWEFANGGRKISVRVEGQAVFNNTFLILQAALDGMGLAYIPSDIAGPGIQSGQLVPVLEEWWPTFTGYHLYYPSRRQLPAALALAINAISQREIVKVPIFD